MTFPLTDDHAQTQMSKRQCQLLNQCNLFPFLPSSTICEVSYEQFFFPISLQSEPVHFPVTETSLIFPFQIPDPLLSSFFFLPTQIFL